MQKNSSNFREGDIVILELPFTDLIGKKLRPVLVLSSEKLNEVSLDVIATKISSSQQVNYPTLTQGASRFIEKTSPSITLL